MLVGGGFVLVVVGAATVFLPGPELSATVVRGVGVLALTLSLVLVLRWPAGTVVTRSPGVHRREHVEQTGSEFERLVRRVRDESEELSAVAESNVRTQLESLAVDVLTERGDRETATQQLADGTWTDDELAASFLDDSADSTGWLRRGPSFETRVSRTVAALARVAGEPTTTNISFEGKISETAAGDDQQDWSTGVDSTDSWRGIGVLVLFALGVGAAFYSVELVLVAALLLGVAGYTQVTASPPSPSIAVERSFDTTEPLPGETVGVTVTVTNEGSSVLPDLRLVDGVPAKLAVVDGTPRYATALAPGESVTYSYGVLAVAGEHTFETVNVAVRDASGAEERTELVDTDPRTITCDPVDVRESVPLHPQASGVTGRVASDVGGSGQEFHSIREYQRGDPPRRIEWNRLARTGDLATVELHEEHAATVVLLVDASGSAFRAPTPDALSAVDRSRAGASQLFATLDRDGDRVGLASIGPERLWIPPGGGSAHRTRIRTALQHDDAFTATGRDRRLQPASFVRTLRRRLPSDAQLLVFSPLLEDDIVDVVRRLDAHGHPVTVFSPDPTTTGTVGGTVVRLERRDRLATLRRAGLPVIDWAGEPLETAVARTGRGEQ